VKAGDWVLVGVGVAQAIALAVAAAFAWLTYKAARREREAARLQPVINETQALAQFVEAFATGGSEESLAEAVGQQARLAVALDFIPQGALPETRELASVTKQELWAGHQLVAARSELVEAVRDPKSVFRQLSGND
jgi:hypothetical protein